MKCSSIHNYRQRPTHIGVKELLRVFSIPSHELLRMIDSLSDEQRVAVEEFIRHLEKSPQQRTDSRSALNSFVREHPELLRRLAQ
jgi:hypothetical protein